MDNRILISKYGGIVLGDRKDTEDFKFFTYESLPKFNDKHKILLAQVLDNELFEELKHKETSSGFTHSNVIQSGVECHDLDLGVVAGDAESYSIFKDLFYKIIKRYHDFDPTIRKHVSSRGAEKLDLKEFNQLKSIDNIISIRTSAVRNIAEHKLPAGTNPGFRQSTEETLKKILARFKGNFSGKYSNISDLSEAELSSMQEKDYAFENLTLNSLILNSGCARDWPNNRGIFSNDDHTVFCWCNNQDHALLISHQQGPKLKMAFENLSTLSDLFIDNLTKIGKNIMQSDNLGYLATSPSDLGTGLKVTAKIKLHKLLKDREVLDKVCKEYLLEVKNDRNFAYDGKDMSVLDIASTRSLGVTDIELLQNFVNGIVAILLLEEKM